MKTLRQNSYKNKKYLKTVRLDCFNLILKSTILRSRSNNLLIITSKIENWESPCFWGLIVLKRRSKLELKLTRSKIIVDTGNAHYKHESPTCYGSKLMIKVNFSK